MSDICCLNGEFVPMAEAKVSVNDRGFVFGDGVYEVVNGHDGRLWTMERHWRRLARSLAELDIRGVDLERLRELSLEAVRRSGYPRPMVYVQVTRGVVPRRHDWDPDGMVATTLITVRPAPVIPPEVMAAGVSCITCEDLRWGRCDIKSINLLGNVMAKQQAHAAGAFEAILVRDGIVTEGSSTSLCIVTDGVLRSHPLTRQVLPSITRQFVLELADDLGQPVVEEPFHVDLLRAADEVFLTGTTSEVLGVTRIDGRPVADGAVGPVTRRLRRAYDEAVAAGADAPRG